MSGRNIHEHEMLISEVEAWPGAQYKFERGTKHPKLVLSVGDRSGIITVSGTTKCRRAHLNNISLIRRKLREMGLERKGSC